MSEPQLVIPRSMSEFNLADIVKNARVLDISKSFQHGFTSVGAISVAAYLSNIYNYITPDDSYNIKILDWNIQQPLEGITIGSIQKDSTDSQRTNDINRMLVKAKSEYNKEVDSFKENASKIGANYFTMLPFVQELRGGNELIYRLLLTGHILSTKKGL